VIPFYICTTYFLIELCKYIIGHDRSQGSSLMLKEPSVIRSWNQSLIPNTPTFYEFLFTQIKESCANGSLALTFILILRGLLRYIYANTCSVASTCNEFCYPISLWFLLIGCHSQDSQPHGWKTRSYYWKLH